MVREKTKIYEDELRSFEQVLCEGDDLYDNNSEGRLNKTYTKLSKRLAEQEVHYALVGGYALILHGVRRFTEDIDLLVNSAGLQKIRDTLLGRGYVTIPGSQRNIRDAETGVRIKFVVSGDYPGDGKKREIGFPQPADVVEDVQHVRVVNLKTLVELKLASGMTGKGRLQDLADVQRLIQVHKLTADYAKDVNKSVRAKFIELVE